MTAAAAPVADRDVQPLSRSEWFKLYLGFGGMVIGQFMAILDIQIVASSLTQIQNGVSASADEIAWVQTIYLLAEVVVMPLTAYMTRLWGTRNTYVVSCLAFIITSVLTGLSTSIEMMIALRALQGFAAGAMIPAVFATAFTAFPPEKRMTANIIIGLIVTLAPTIGPTLGGHLTESLSWRWLFFVNVPPGLLVLYLVGRYGNFDKGDPSLAKGVDFPGLAMMAIGLLSIQYVLEEGAENNWFADDAILWLTVLGSLTLAGFIWRQLTYRQPIVSLKPFADRNFSLGIVMTLVSGIALYGGTFILPLFLGQIRHYSAAEIGTTMLISGISMFLTGPLLRFIIPFLGMRVSIVGGFLLVAYAVGLGAHVTEQWGFWEFALLQALRGVGVMVAMVAAQQMTVSTIPQHQMKDASALVNLTRNVGGAVGLAMLSTLLTIQQREHLGELSSRVSQASQQSQQMLAGLTGLMSERGVADPDGAAYKAFAMILQREASVLAFGDAFLWLAAGGVLAAGLALFAASPKNTSLNAGGH